MADTFGGFPFDVEVFGDYMAEQNTIDTSIEASGIIKDDASIMGLIGEKAMWQPSRSIPSWMRLLMLP